MQKNRQKDGVTVVTDYNGNTVKYGSVKADDTPRSTFEKAEMAMNKTKTKNK